MSILSIVLVLTSAGIHISWNALTKSSSNPRLFSLFKGTLLMMMTVILALNLDLSVIPARAWMIIVGSGLIHMVYILGLSSAYEKGDISFVYPIVRSAPIFVPLAAFIAFGEKISIRGGSGILIVIVSMFILLVQGKMVKWRSLLGVIFQKENVWAFVTLGTVVLYSIADKAGMNAFEQVNEIPPHLHGVTFFLLEIFVCFLLYWIVMLKNQKPIRMEIWRKEWCRIFVAAVAEMISYTLILHVMKTENLSYIVTLRQSSILFAVVIGWFYFREPYFRVRLLVAMLMVSGLYLTVTG